MVTALRCIGLLLVVAGVVGEVRGTIPASGLTLVLGTCLGIYLWFLASTRREMEPPQRRRG